MSEVVRLLESVQRWKDTAPAVPEGRQTLRSLMDTIADVPSVGVHDLAPLVDLRHLSSGAGRFDLFWPK